MESSTPHPAQLAREIADALDALPERTTVPVRELRRGFSRRIAAWEPRHVVELAERLLDGGDDVRRLVAYELVSEHRPALRSLGAAELERLGRGMASWVAVDTFGCYVSGPAWREGQVADEVIHGWAASPDRWWRRAALVSTIGLNNCARGGRGDTPRTLALCALLAADRDDMVVKAVSWSLRELCKRDPAAVEAFVERHRATLAPRVLREVANKLRTGLKNPRPA
jgi:3-methyladenine DNA glycosylase AlkD